MRPCTIDFARTVARAHTLSWSAAGLMLLLAAMGIAAAVAAGALGEREAHVREQVDGTRRALQQARSLAIAKQVPPPVPALSPTQISAIASAANGLNVPWRDLLDAVEAATPSSVAVLALEPDAKHHRLTILAQAASVDDMLAYGERLKQQATFVSAVLVRHETLPQEPQAPTRFQVIAHWRDERKRGGR